MPQTLPALSIILPCRNEALSLPQLLSELHQIYPDAERIVVDDGSDDDSAAIARQCGALVVRHPYPQGNGAAIKTGARTATAPVLVFMDADGQHQPDDIARLLAKLDVGYAMAVGARSAQSQASVGRWAANTLYNRLSSWMVGQRIEDLTSGFRAVQAPLFREFLYLLPNGFSYPTTITMAFFRSAYPVAYVPIVALQRQGKSHIRPLRDGARFLLIIFRVATLYAPVKLFLPISLTFFTLGLGNYLYTFMVAGRFTNMSALLFITAMLVFLIGLISEQITNLLFAYGAKRE